MKIAEITSVPVVLFPPRPDLNGSLLKLPGDAKVYLVDQGFRRWIQDPRTEHALFGDHRAIVENQLILDVPEGTPILPGTVLARADDGTPPVYLVEPGIKRHIANPHTMTVYQFTGGKVYSVPFLVLLNIPNGPDISA